MQSKFLENGEIQKEKEVVRTNNSFVKGSHGLLKEAVKKLRNAGYVHIRILSDKKGVFCIEYPKFFLTANGYLFRRSIISNQKEIIHRAKIYRKQLVVYIGQISKFYMFSPQDIINDHWENDRGYLKMYNWDISLGTEMVT